jgi:hypothetical protein
MAANFLKRQIAFSGIALPVTRLHTLCASPQEPTMNETPIAQPFLTDVTTLRERARQNIEKGAVTFTYQGDVNNTIEILQSVLATEIVCVLRYHPFIRWQRFVSLSRSSTLPIKTSFAKNYLSVPGMHCLNISRSVL